MKILCRGAGVRFWHQARCPLLRRLLGVKAEMSQTVLIGRS
jgi:hypothetical protein